MPEGSAGLTAAREPPPRAAPAPSGSQGTLAEEVALLQEAQWALRNGDPLVALTVLRRLDERFPNGVLREEHEAAQVLARCAGDLSGQERGAAAAFVKRYPGSAYAPRVRAACGPAAQLPVDCGVLALCTMPGVCQCTASGCTADSTSANYTFDLSLAGDRADGTVAGLGSGLLPVHFTRTAE